MENNPMSNKYKVKVIFEIEGDWGARFRMDLKLPFAPTKDTIISKRSAVVIKLGPFEKVVYNLDNNKFTCWIKPWSPSGENKEDDIKQTMKNLRTEGWTRID